MKHALALTSLLFASACELGLQPPPPAPLFPTGPIVAIFDARTAPKLVGACTSGEISILRTMTVDLARTMNTGNLTSIPQIQAAAQQVSPTCYTRFSQVAAEECAQSVIDTARPGTPTAVIEGRIAQCYR